MIIIFDQKKIQEMSSNEISKMRLNQEMVHYIRIIKTEWTTSHHCKERVLRLVGNGLRLVKYEGIIIRFQQNYLKL